MIVRYSSVFFSLYLYRLLNVYVFDTVINHIKYEKPKVYTKQTLVTHAAAYIITYVHYSFALILPISRFVSQEKKRIERKKDT